MPRHSRRLRIERLEDRTTPTTFAIPLADAVLDPTFGTGGIVELRPDGLPPPISPAAPKVVGLPGGGAYVLGSFNGNWFVERLTPDGTPDPTFGTNGRARLVEASIPEVRFTFTDLAVTSDGGVVAVGYEAPFLIDIHNPSLVVVKLTAAGQLDTAFNGKAAAQRGFGPGADGTAEATGVAVAADGSVFVAGTGTPLQRGSVLPGGEIGNEARAGVVKFRPDGTPDPTFDGDGAMSFGEEAREFIIASPALAIFPPPPQVPTGLDVRAADIAVDAEGRVFLTGSSAHVFPPVIILAGGDSIYGNPRASRPYAARLSAAGQLDASFDADGIVRLTPPTAFPSGSPMGQWVGLRADGTAMVGMLDQGGYYTHFSVAHLTEAGAIDTAYGDLGYAVVADTNGVADIATAPDGSVIAVSGRDLIRDPAVTQLPPHETRIYRVTADGTVRPAERLPVGSPSDPIVGASVGIGPDGRVTVTAVSFGFANGEPTDDGRIVVARLDEGVDTPPDDPPEPGPPVLVPGPDGRVRRFEGGVDGRLQDRGMVTPFPGFTGRVRSVTADVDGDGVDDLVFVTGPGTPARFTVVKGPDVRTLLVPLTDPFGVDFTGGAFVAAGDIDGDGRAEVVITPDQGGGPNVVLFSLNDDRTLAEPRSFFALGNPDFRGGARPAVGDLNNDGLADLAVGAGFLGGPKVEVHDGKALVDGDFDALIGGGFFAFDGPDAATLRNGVFLSVGDITGDGFADLIVGGGPGGGPRVLGLDGRMLAAGDVAGAFAAPVVNFFVGDDTHRGGVRVAVVDTDLDDRADLVAAPGDGDLARVYNGRDFTGPGEPSEFQEITPLPVAADGEA